ncbi:MAG: hypothetical protein HYU37_17750, partial [Acidobacteria bacterium]|nr:hypothetical protein [Acidobacteriota bacterium]
IGIAEFANANFFSEDTLAGTDAQGRRLPFPRREDLIRRRDIAPLSPRIRAYLEKPAGQGLVTKFALAECRLQGRAALPPYPCVDEAVWDETAAHMLPRAVGYARAVLDYFFRGQIGVQTSFMRAGLAFIQISNLTDEEMSGVFEVFARPGAPLSGEGRERSALVNGGAVATIGPRRSVLLPITYLQAEPTPFHMLVFRGRIGLEDDAVAAKTFAVHHVVIAQTAHTADLNETCTLESSSNRDDTLKSERQACSWRSIRQQTDGELITSRSTLIKRMSVSAPFPGVELLLDGLPASAGVWQRQGEEGNPRSFSVRWSRPTGTATLPTLTIELGDGSVSMARIYGTIAASAEASKGYHYSTNPPSYVYAKRAARVDVASPRVAGLTSYRAVSVGGYPNPTNIVTDRFGVPGLVEALIVSEAPDYPQYQQRWTDHANLRWTVPPGGTERVLEPYQTELAALSYGPPPRVPIEAVFERDYRQGELDFLRTFVTPEPPPSTLTVVGRRPGGS